MLISSSLKAFACAVATFCYRHASAVEPVICTDKQLWPYMLAYEANMPGSKCPSLPALPPMAPDQPLMLLLRACEDLVADHHANLRWMRLAPSTLNRAAAGSKHSPKIHKTRAFRSPASGRPQHAALSGEPVNIIRYKLGCICVESMGHIVKLDGQVTSTKLGAQELLHTPNRNMAAVLGFWQSHRWPRFPAVAECSPTRHIPQHTAALPSLRTSTSQAQIASSTVLSSSPLRL